MTVDIWRNCRTATRGTRCYGLRHVDWHQANSGMCSGEHAEQFVRECRSDLGHALEVQHDFVEALELLRDALGLSAGHELFALVLLKSHRDDCLVGHLCLGGGEAMDFAEGSSHQTNQIAARRCTVSGYCLTRLISSAACALGLARPCSQFSSVRTFVRR